VTVRDDLLVDVAALAAVLAQPEPPTLLDVRWRLQGPPGRVDYAAGHLPGAVFVDLDADLCGPPGVGGPSGAGGRHPLPDPAALQGVLRRAGVRAGHPVVVYDGGDGMAAARAWWTLRWAGHRAVRVLDGGYPAWLAEGRPVTAEPTEPTPGDITVRPGALPVLDAADAARLAAGDAVGHRAAGDAAGDQAGSPDGGGGVLIDVRARARYRGETEPIDPVAGHIPGAINVPSTEHVGAGGRLRAPAELAAAFTAAGVRDTAPVGAYCGSGVTAAHTVLALHLAGRPDAALYVGSWSDWISRPDRPVATGEGT
jgi:thiosulfate/3-mercaptopyruvate sulfurtransferase